MTAIAEIEEPMTQDIVVIDIEKATAINELQDGYTQMLTEWDTTKAEVDFETKMTMNDLQNDLDKKSQTTNNHEQINRDLSKARDQVNNLDGHSDDIIQKASKIATPATFSATGTTVSKVILDMQENTNNHLENMDEVFRDNMDLMADLHSSYSIRALCKDANFDAFTDVQETFDEKKSLVIKKSPTKNQI